MRATTTSVQYVCVWAGLMMVCLTFGSGCGGDDDTEGSTSNNSGTTTGSTSNTATGSSGETSIDALPERTWSWLEVEGMRCANGSPTGIGVNRNTASPNVVVYLEGGGACWDHETCYELAAASNITTGFDASAFQMQAIPAVEGIEVFRRDASNPLQDWNQIYVPYCTGDLHAGSKTNDYNGQTTMHVGRANIQQVLGLLTSTFTSANRVVLTGSSAGGYGASLSYALFAENFAGVRVDMINDGGPPIPTPAAPPALMQTWINTWNLTAAAPPGCSGCDANVAAYMTANFAAYPNARFALLSFTEDDVLTQYYGIDGPTFTQGLNALRADGFEGAPNAFIFYRQGVGHTMYGELSSNTEGGVDAWSWLTQMLNDDAAWGDIAP